MTVTYPVRRLATIHSAAAIQELHFALQKLSVWLAEPFHDNRSPIPSAEQILH
jgi:hypothetical protein